LSTRRAGTQTAYPWGDEIGKNNANCAGCGTRWDNKQPSPIRAFAANRFGLHDMHGNVWQWLEDCDHANYERAPRDGSPRLEGSDCHERVVSGGSWHDGPEFLRSADRGWNTFDGRLNFLGLRVGPRSLLLKVSGKAGAAHTPL